jgi:hypothetical protein
MKATHNVRIKRGLGRHLAAASNLDRFILEELLDALEENGPELEQWPDFEQLPRVSKQPRGVTLYRCSLRQAEPNVTAFWRVSGDDIEVHVLHWGSLTAIDDRGELVYPGL